MLRTAVLALALASGGDRRAQCLARNADAPARYAGLVRALCADLHNLGGVGASVAVGERGALRFVATAGQRCANGADVEPDTAFRVGSLTKLWTAALALTVIDDGLATLDEPVVRVVPELGVGVDARLGETSLRGLLSHTAGLRELWPSDVPDQSAWLDDLAAQTLTGEPGALWSYSNVGFGVAGAALERALGTTYEVALHERVLAPLGARRTTADPELALRRGAACGHLGRGADAWPLDVRADLQIGAAGARWSAPAGGLIAPAGELVTLLLGLVDPVRSPLSARAIDELLQVQVDTHERPGEGYALGLRVQRLADGSAMYVHTGNTGDFAAELYLVPARGFALVLLGNTGDPLQGSAAAALQELLGVRPTLPGPAGPLERYVGEYEDDGRMMSVGPGPSLDGAALEHGGDHRFRVGDDARSRVTFVFADDDARASHLRGPGFVAARAQAPRWK